MVNVIASVHLKEGALDEYLRILLAGLPAVRSEKGCVAYAPALDMETGMPLQVRDRNVVTILERWESLDALRTHLASPHMLEYREKVKDLVESVSLKVLREIA